MDDDHAGDFRPPFSNRNPYDMNNKIMLSAIISLVVVVFLVILLHIYARCVLRRQARRQAVLQRLTLRVAQFRMDEPPKTGLDPLVIAALPTFKFKLEAKEDKVDESTRPECTVCLSLLEDEEMARLLPNCKHAFHVECIDKWLNAHATCPVCRTDAKPLFQAEPREPPVRSTESCCMEGTSYHEGQELAKCNGSSSSRFSSFRKMLTRDRSSRRIQSFGHDDDIEDLESQRH